MTWHCTNCITDWPAPFCDECGAALNVRNIHHISSRRAPAQERINGASPERVSELIEELGPTGAMTLVGLDAVYAVLLGGAA